MRSYSCLVHEVQMWAEPGLSVLGLRNPFLELAVGVRPVVQHVLNTIHPLYNIYSRIVQHLLNITLLNLQKKHSRVVQHILRLQHSVSSCSTIPEHNTSSSYSKHSRVVQHLLNTTHYLTYKINSLVVQHVLNTISLSGNNIHSRVVQNVLTTTHPHVTTYILELFNTSSGYNIQSRVIKHILNTTHPQAVLLLRIRIRDPVLFRLLDPGSGMDKK